MSPINIDWNAIRPFNGSRANAFEELCAQLAFQERPAGSHFDRKGTPDAGVECFAVLADGSEWGWQAKYFDGLGDAQWPQLDDSVKTALEKHPRLLRYFVCLPLDRPDARIDGRRSAKERWDDHVKKWTGWASDRGITIEIVYWGSHELLERLAKPQNVGRLRFWFDIRGFDNSWFAARLDEALKTAGPRYTPKLHIQLPIAADLDAFGRTERFFDRVKNLARDIRKKLGNVRYSLPKASDPELGALFGDLSTKVQAILSEFAVVTTQPTGVLPFQRISELAKDADASLYKLDELLSEKERAPETGPSVAGADGTTKSRANNPFRDCRYRLGALSSELRTAREALDESDSIAGNSLLLLTGAAGTGKTHLLCDVSQQRVAAGKPTVLLMGQRFTSKAVPWVQALQQLDLPDLSAEAFVGALEAAAQAAGCRALLLIDAINEGSGRDIWPDNLAAFLAHAERSPWIGVVLSVRSSYEEILVPQEISDRAAHVTHQGFAEHEYDATRAFFVYYGLELPSTPLLAPEFRNPLYLKTLCEGLQAKGERRLPRGFHGITESFNLYLGAINSRLAQRLGFDPKDDLVVRALQTFAKALVSSEYRWLTRRDARKVVDELLPGRDFGRSLYHGLVSEGVLIEHIARHEGGADDEIAFIAYDRFADHLVAKVLLDEHLDKDNPAAAFLEKAPLAFICDKARYTPPGLLEAMCVQVPELTGQELISVAPKIIDHREIGDAFRQSLVWRAVSAFSEGTRDALNKVIRNQHDSDDTLDVLLTVATLPAHPFNATFLDRRLRKDLMPDRDAWWSTYLHRAWGEHGAVDRLVDWASSAAPSTALEEEAVDLTAMALTWMLTTSNRFLRDRATQALVNLLTERLGSVTRLVERFADVDDPYVAERVYAVAYGTAMRSHDTTEVSTLAACVYARVFANRTPPAHILLRDYARGVVERALYLNADLAIEAERIRPPYVSEWPAIPTEDEIKPLLPDWTRGGYDDRDAEWARNHIGNSVMDDDFARYVIGTNSSPTSSDWLALRLEDPPWQSVDARIAGLVEGFSEKERSAWETFEAADDVVRQKQAEKTFALFRKAIDGDGSADGDADVSESGDADDSDVERAEEERGAAHAALMVALSDDHARRISALMAEKDSDEERGRPPHFELRQIQRYVLWRVFDLGWTTERFGEFDRYSIGYHGRDASKAERIGKKYQWIAYHEIMALVADHFQYREQYREEEGDKAYEGPWQISMRNIDPSCTLRALPGGTSWNGHSKSWWGTAIYENWGVPSDFHDWARYYGDLPRVEDLLRVSRPDDASNWLNVNGYFYWRQQPPADKESEDVERRELWYLVTGYLIHATDTDAYLKWAENVDFWGRWMPDPPEIWRMFLGEHGWAPASRYFQKPYFGDEGWTQPGHGCPVELRTCGVNYLREASGFDCSVNETYALRLPTSELVNGAGLRWSANGADLIDSVGHLAAFDPTAHAPGPSSLLLREDLMRDFLARAGLSICWAVLGEKRVTGPGLLDAKYHASMRISGAYILDEKGPIGFLKCMLSDREVAGAEDFGKPYHVIRTPGCGNKR